MSTQYPDFKNQMIGLTACALPFLWYFEWAVWAWCVVGLCYAAAIYGWFAEALQVYRANKAGGGPSAPTPFKSDFVRAGQEGSPQSAGYDFDDEYVKGKTIWSGNKQIRFAYRNAVGDYSDREVTVHKVGSSGSGWSDDIYFVGHCHLRNEPRTFRLDRVRHRNKVVDTATGEVGTLRQILGVKRRVSR